MEFARMTDDQIYFSLTILFNLWGFAFVVIQYLLSIPIIVQMRIEGNMLDIQPVKHVAALFGATIWLYCSVLSHAVTMISFDVVGWVIMLSCIGVYTRCMTIEARRQMWKLLAIYMVVCAIIIPISIYAFHGLIRSQVIAGLSVIASICSLVSILIEAVRCIIANREHNNSTKGGVPGTIRVRVLMGGQLRKISNERRVEQLAKHDVEEDL